VESPAVEEGPVTGRTVLIVEDEPAIRAYTAAVLKREGYTVLEACDGIDGLRVAASHDGEIDLLLTDVVMPSMSGAELAARLKVMRPGLATMFMSGYSGHPGLAEAGCGLSDHFIQKPFSISLLLSRVAEALSVPLNQQESHISAHLLV